MLRITNRIIEAAVIEKKLLAVNLENALANATDIVMELGGRD